MRERTKAFLTAFAGGAVAMAMAFAVNAIADSNPATDQVAKLIPYQGTLEKDGVAVTGAVTLVFQLFDGPTATTPVWDEELTVQVYAGRFTALLGSSTAAKSTALATALNNADDLYLAVSLKPDGTTAVPLSNRQRFLPVPYAMWTTASTNLKVSAIDANGTSTLWLNSNSKQDVSVGGKLEIKGYDLRFAPWNAATRGDGGRAMVHDNGDTLVLNYNGEFAGGVRMEGDVNLTGSLAAPTLTVGTRLNGDIQSAHCDGGAWDCTCPAGHSTLSGGFMCPAGSSGVMSYPTPDSSGSYLQGWHATCQNTSGTEVKPSTVWVVCSRMF